MFYIWDKKHQSTIGLYENKDDADAFIVRMVSAYADYSLADFAVKERDDRPAAMEARLFLMDGTYQPPVWAEEGWYLERAEDIKAFAHIDIDNPKNILYFESVAKLDRGRTTSTTPGRFLKKYFGDILTEADILKWTNTHKEEWLDGDILSWAKTGEEIAAVYEMDANFSSCMQHKMSTRSGGWPSDLPVHPTYPYGAGDLEVAYLHKAGRLTGRALVWRKPDPADTLVGRVYGDIVGMRNALRKAGIVTDSDQNEYDTFAGARLLYVPYKRDELDTSVHNDSNGNPLRRLNKTEVPRVVIPYIDGSVEGLTISEDGKYLILTDQCWDEDWRKANNPTTFKASDPAGWASGMCTCVKCGKERRQFYDIITKDGDELVVDSWCTHCYSDETYYSELTYERYDRAYFKQVRITVQGYWGPSTQYAVEGMDPIVKTMEQPSIWRRKDQCTLLKDGTYCPTYLLSTLAFESDVDGEIYQRKDRTVVNGKYMTLQQAETYRAASPDEWHNKIPPAPVYSVRELKESLFGEWH